MKNAPHPSQVPPHHRLARSSREVMWAGVAGGMAEYFGVDPVLVRLVWVAGTIVTGGLGVLVYFVLWIVMPRDDRVQDSNGRGHWQGWSSDFQSSTREFAEEARRFASEVSGHTTGTHPQGYSPGAATASDPFAQPTAGTGEYPPYSASVPPIDPWSESEFEHRHRERPGPQRNAGLVLVGLGLVFLANNAGLFRWIDWHYLWPLMLVVMGVILLARQINWRR